MNYHELVRQLTPLRGEAEAQAVCRLVMETCFGLSLTDLLLGKDSDLSPNDHQKFQNIALRLLAGEPVQHILGFATFCGHRFHVTPDVLIPRPETEELVVRATEPTHPTPSTILDLCTGSGCIAISLALAFPQAQVIGIDISAPALEVARDNALQLGASNVTFRQGDITQWDYSDTETYDLIVSNPPYIRPIEARDMEDVVLRHEPHLALFAPEEDPLFFYRHIAEISRRIINHDGFIIVEVNTALSSETASLFTAAHFTHVHIFNDQFGQPRLVEIGK